MKIHKLLSILIIFICLLVCLSTVNAENIDNNLTDSSPDDIIIYEEVNETEDVDITNSECCSFIIQERDETVFAFRQDGALVGRGIEINHQNVNGLNIIKQQVESTTEYFFHGIITENGWVIGQGGSQYNDSSRSIENLAFEMIKNNYISPDKLKQINNILSKYDYGHFVIKAPDGRFGVAFANTYHTGTLQEGECLVVPNYYSYYFRTTYKKYNSNPVDAIIIIASYENSGYHRKDLITYDYKAHDTENGVYYGVDVFATNDNGRNVGLNTANYVTHFYFKGKYFSAASIPQNPHKIYAGTHIFETQRLNPVIEVIDGKNNGLVGEEINIHYQIKYLVAERTAVFNLDKNFEFIKANAQQGSYTYNSQEHAVYWKVPASKNPRDITITLKPKALGDYNIHSYIRDMNENHDMYYYATDYGAILTTQNVNKYKGGQEQLKVLLTDKYSKPLIGEQISITINGVTYNRETKNNGYASLNINLGSGEYIAIINYDGKFGKNQTTSEIVVQTTISADNIEKYYKNATQFKALFLDTNGKPLKNTNIQFNINGIIYTRLSDENGIGKLNINLDPNEYIITSINTITGEQKSNKVIVKPVLVDNKNLVKYYMNDSQYTVKLLDGEGKSLRGENVSFNINGVFYKRTTDENGIAKLNINLNPGQYIITAQYNGGTVSNTITVLERVITNDLTMQYMDGSKFKATILNQKGEILKNESVIFNINGVFYNRTADLNGTIELNIRLQPGQYIITTYWNKYSKPNKITII